LRLQAIAAGAPAASGELVDINFALIATEIEREQRFAKFECGQYRSIRWLIYAGVALAELSVLLCMLLLFITLTFHEWPF
jgi:hypothetical protein